MTERTNDPDRRRLDRHRRDGEWTPRKDAGRLQEEGSGLTDNEKDEVATEEPEDLEGRSAEEAAVRVEDDPEGLTGGPDRYVEDDEDAG